jgi:hypothetical protein
MRQRPGLEVPGEGAELAPLEVRQARRRVWCLVVMAPLEVPKGQVSAGARSREELLVFGDCRRSRDFGGTRISDCIKNGGKLLQGCVLAVTDG